MKMNLKLLALTVSLGTLFYFLKGKPEQKPQEIQYITISIDEKSPKSTTAKPLYSAPAQNYLGIGNNINSKRP
jgi:hypothetical protein